MDNADIRRIERKGPATWEEAQWVYYQFGKAANRCMCAANLDELREYQCRLEKWSRWLDACMALRAAEVRRIESDPRLTHLNGAPIHLDDLVVGLESRIVSNPEQDAPMRPLMTSIETSISIEPDEPDEIETCCGDALRAIREGKWAQVKLNGLWFDVRWTPNCLQRKTDADEIWAPFYGADAQAWRIVPARDECDLSKPLPCQSCKPGNGHGDATIWEDSES